MGSKSSKIHDQKITSTPSQLSSKRAQATPNSDTSVFAVITVIFNPINYQSRYNHYDNFVEHMVESGVHLLTVECIFESTSRFYLPYQKFEITRADDPSHIQLRAPSILWLKENLINIAVERLPPHIEFVSWIDADIEFERLDWPQLAINELQQYPIVQLFEVANFLGPNGKDEILRRDYSMGYSIRHDKPITPSRSDWYAHPGYAWAMRRKTFADIGGLLEFCIIGSGDLHFAYALLHRIEETIRPNLHQDYRQLAIAWGDKVAQAAENGGNVSYVPVNICHHWHGERNDRNYVNRWAILEKHKFSPLNDLMKHGDTGLLRLVDENTCFAYERIEAMEADIVEYFKSRNEDNTTRTTDSSSRQETKKSVPPQKQPYRSGLPSSRTRDDQKYSVQSQKQSYRSGSSRSQFRRDDQNYWPNYTNYDTAHVGDNYPHSHQCTCDGRHHTDNHHCSCTSHQIDDKPCWDATEHHPEICLPTNDESHHHHRIDGEECSSHVTHEHAYHDSCRNDDGNSGYTYDGRDDSSQHYDGPGSFY